MPATPAAVEKSHPFAPDDRNWNITAPADDQVPYAFPTIQSAQSRPASEAIATKALANTTGSATRPPATTPTTLTVSTAIAAKNCASGNACRSSARDEWVVAPEDALGERELVQRAEMGRTCAWSTPADQASRLT